MPDQAKNSVPDSAPSTAQEDASYDDLLKQYLRVCNRALEENQNRFPYSQIWRAGETALSGRSVEFAVIDDEPKAQCKVTLQENRINSQADQPGEAAPVMRLSAKYISDVVAHPDKYIENPSLIDWEWLQLMK